MWEVVILDDVQEHLCVGRPRPAAPRGGARRALHLLLECRITGDVRHIAALEHIDTLTLLQVREPQERDLTPQGIDLIDNTPRRSIERLSICFTTSDSRTPI